MKKTWRSAAICGLAVLGSLVVGCQPPANPNDPWEKFNRASYKFNDKLDQVALKPLSDGYVKVVPQPVRTGVGNFFDNLVYLNVVLNDFLQQKWHQGTSDTLRFATNSTIGILGIFDPATPLNMPAHKNDLGLTLRRYGAKPGPYLVIPVLGPSTVVDATDYPVEYLVTPTNWYNIKWYVTYPLYAADTIDLRSRYDSVIRFRNDAAIDPYVFTREAYLQYREQEASGVKPTTQSDLYEDVDAAPPGATTNPETSGK